MVSRPSIASDGTESLVVWNDLRNRVAVVYGLLLARSGSVLDPGPFVIHSAAGAFFSSPRVAFDSTPQFGTYLVVWSEGRMIQGSLVSPRGVGPARKITTGDSPATAFDGRNFFVVSWVFDYPEPGRIEGVRVDRGGRVLDPTGIPLGSTVVYRPETAIGFNGTNYLVVWSAIRDLKYVIEGVRVKPDGTVLDAQPLRIATGIADPNSPQTVASPAIGSDGTSFFVVWSDARFGCCSIFGTRVSGDGRVLDPTGIAIATRGHRQVDPAIAYDGARYLVAWTDNRALTADIYAARVVPDGRVLDPRGILVSTARPPKRRCVVPRVIGMSLTRAKRSIHRARCSVAGIRTRRVVRRQGRVVAQSPRPGTVRPTGYSVRLVVGRR